MRSIIRISDGAAIALHAADYLAGQGKPLSSTAEIAKALGVSYNHLSKVLQQLARAGLLLPARGPKGGFALSNAGEKARVRDFVSAIDGAAVTSACLLGNKVCGHRACLFGAFLAETNKRFEAVMGGKLSELSKRK